MILYKLYFVVLTTLLALQTCMNVSTADGSSLRTQHSRNESVNNGPPTANRPRIGNGKTRKHSSKNPEVSDRFKLHPSNINGTNLTKADKEDNIRTPLSPAKLQDMRHNNPKIADYQYNVEDNVKPATIEDWIDSNLKNVIIGMIVAAALFIITLVCCCVCCAATVCNRTTKRRDTKSKRHLHSSEEHEYYHETTCNARICNPRTSLKSRNETS